MALRTLISVFDADGEHVQALVQSMPRSFKMHVWAAPVEANQLTTSVLEYIGTIQPIDQTDSSELEFLIQDLYLNGQDTRTR